MIKAEDYFGVVHHIYNTKYASKFSYLKDDLISEGYLGILDGIKAYNQHNHEYQIQTYIYRNVHARMYKFISKELNHKNNTSLDEDDSQFTDTLQGNDNRLDYVATTIDLKNAMSGIKNEVYKDMLNKYSQGYMAVDYRQSTHQNTQQKLKRAIQQLKENYINGTR